MVVVPAPFLHFAFFFPITLFQRRFFASILEISMPFLILMCIMVRSGMLNKSMINEEEAIFHFWCKLGYYLLGLVSVHSSITSDRILFFSGLRDPVPLTLCDP